MFRFAGQRRVNKSRALTAARNESLNTAKDEVLAASRRPARLSVVKICAQAWADIKQKERAALRHEEEAHKLRAEAQSLRGTMTDLGMDPPAPPLASTRGVAGRAATAAHADGEAVVAEATTATEGQAPPRRRQRREDAAPVQERSEAIAPATVATVAVPATGGRVTRFVVVVDVVGVVVAFLPLHLRLLMRTISYRWHTAVCQTLLALTCSAATTDTKFHALVTAFPEVRSLVLSGTVLTAVGLSALRRFAGLETLKLTVPHLTSEGLAQVMGLKSLTSLEVHCTAKISGAAVGGVFTLHKLKSLVLVGCTKLTNARLAKLPPRLKSLELRRCLGLTDQGLADLPSQLQHLRIAVSTSGSRSWGRESGLNDSRFTDAAIALLPVGLTSLDLTGSRYLADATVASLGRFPSLTKLSLVRCRSITANAARSIARLVNLRSLDLSGASAIRADIVGDLAPLVNLTSLHLSNAIVREGALLPFPSLTSVSKVSGAAVQSRRGCPQLDASTARDDPSPLSSLADLRNVPPIPTLSFIASLDLSRWEGHVSDDDLKFVGKLTELRALFLRDCKNISDRGVQELVTLTWLTTLCLDGCEQVTWRGLQAVARLPALRRLGIHGCDVDGAAIQELAGLNTLTQLYVHRWERQRSTRDGVFALSAALPALLLYAHPMPKPNEDEDDD